MKKIIIFLIVLSVVIGFSISLVIFLWTLFGPDEDPNSITANADFSTTKTYQNSEYGFEFQYPGNFTTIVASRDDGGLQYFQVFVIEARNPSFISRKIFSVPSSKKIQIRVVDFMAAKTAFSFNRPRNAEDVTFNGVKFVRYMSNASLTYIAQGNSVVAHTESKYQEITEKILSTFRFI